MSFKNQYTFLDKLLHRISFVSGSAQVGISDIEDKIYAEKLKNVIPSKPLFITALPRAGTTVLLNLLVSTGQFASHTYRDMPFVFCPMIWQRFSTMFQKDVESRERAHGDGLNISSESPEAFEEMLWKLFWKDNYKRDRIELWKDCNDLHFVDFVKSHMRKIVALRFPQGGHQRYASKNNLNVARLQLLPRIFPDSLVIIPFREPMQHAMSLHQQHLRFLEMHKLDRFSVHYMKGIGHFDFGENLLPINFDNWLNKDRRNDATNLQFWVEYWIAAYSHILNQTSETMHLLSYSSLVKKPVHSLERLASVVGLADARLLTSQVETLRSPREYEIDVASIPLDLLDKAQDLYLKLQKRSII